MTTKNKSLPLVLAGAIASQGCSTIQNRNPTNLISSKYDIAFQPETCKVYFGNTYGDSNNQFFPSMDGITPKEYVQRVNNNFASIDSPKKYLEMLGEVTENYNSVLGMLDSLSSNNNCKPEDLPNKEEKIQFGTNYGLFKGLDCNNFIERTPNPYNLRKNSETYGAGLAGENACIDSLQKRVFSKKKPWEIIDMAGLGVSFADPLVGASVLLMNRIINYSDKLIDGNFKINEAFKNDFANITQEFRKNEYPITGIAEITNNIITPNKK